MSTHIMPSGLLPLSTEIKLTAKEEIQASIYTSVNPPSKNLETIFIFFA